MHEHISTTRGGDDDRTFRTVSVDCYDGTNACGSAHAAIHERSYANGGPSMLDVTVHLTPAEARGVVEALTAWLAEIDGAVQAPAPAGEAVRAS